MLLLAVLWARGGISRSPDTKSSDEVAARLSTVSSVKGSSGHTPHGGGGVEVRSPPDLYASAQDLRLKASAGDVKAEWLLTRIYDYCGAFTRDPVAYTANTNQPGPSRSADQERVYLASRHRLEESCRRFTPADIPSFQQLMEERRVAAIHGSLAAQASMLAMASPISSEPDYAGKLAHKVFESNDPDALLALSDAMTQSKPALEAIFPDTYSALEANYATQLMACKAGLDCSATGWLMTAYCAVGSMCNTQGNLSGMIRHDLLTPSAAARVDGLIEGATK